MPQLVCAGNRCLHSKVDEYGVGSYKLIDVLFKLFSEVLSNSNSIRMISNKSICCTGPSLTRKSDDRLTRDGYFFENL